MQHIRDPDPHVNNFGSIRIHNTVFTHRTVPVTGVTNNTEDHRILQKYATNQRQILQNKVLPDPCSFQHYFGNKFII
jgi:hypothetical protein